MVSVSKIAVCVAAALSTLAVPLRVMAQEYPLPLAPNAAPAAPAVQPGQLEQLVAPIALYPDSLLSQVLMASTYPIEVVEAARWRQANPHLAGDDLEQALRAQDWDPSVKSLVAFPTVLDMMNDRINWTTELGDAFLAQQAKLMDTVQQLRYRAQSAGNLQSTAQQVVINDPAGPSNIIRIEPARPDVIYVPTYNPVYVYGPWLYPAYEPFYWYPPGYIAAGAIFGFTAGFFVGHALWGGYDWHRHDVRIVNVNYYNNYWHGRYAGGPWQHDPGHRRGVGYGDGPGRSFYGGGPGGPRGPGGPGYDHRFGSREQFRPQADAGRRNLGSVDRGSLQDRGPGGGFGNGRPFAGPGGTNGPQGGGRGPEGGPGRGEGGPGTPGGGPQAGGGRGGEGGGRQGPLGGFQGGTQVGQGGAQIGPGGAQVGRGGAQLGQGGAQLGQGGAQLGNGGGQLGQGGFQGGGRGGAMPGGGQPSPPQGIMGGGGGRPQGGGGMPGGGGGPSPRPQSGMGGMSNVSAGGGAPRMEGGGGARFEGGRGGGGGAPRMEGGRGPGGGFGREGGGGGGREGGGGGGGGGREGGGGHGR